HTASIPFTICSFFCSSCVPCALHSFPTRRSSDLQLLDGLAILQRQRFALALLLGTPATAVRSLIKTGDERGVRSILLDAFLHLLIETGDERGDQHDDTDAEDHAENGKEAAQLVGAERVHRLLEIFAVLLRHVGFADPPGRTAFSLPFCPKRFNRIQLCRGLSWGNAKEKTDARGDRQ